MIPRRSASKANAIFLVDHMNDIIMFFKMNGIASSDQLHFIIFKIDYFNSFGTFN